MAGKRYKVFVQRQDGRVTSEYVVAWDFTIVNGGVLVFSDRTRTRAYRNWVEVKQED